MNLFTESAHSKECLKALLRQSCFARTKSLNHTLTINEVTITLGCDHQRFTGFGTDNVKHLVWGGEYPYKKLRTCLHRVVSQSIVASYIHLREFHLIGLLLKTYMKVMMVEMRQSIESSEVILSSGTVDPKWGIYLRMSGMVWKWWDRIRIPDSSKPIGLREIEILYPNTLSPIIST